MSRGMDADRPTLGRRLKEVLLGETRRDLRNSLGVMIWTLLWGAAYTGTLQAIKAGLAKGAVTWVLVSLTAFTGLMAIRAYVRFVREADEMVQKVYIDALAFGFAVGAVFVAASEILSALGGPHFGGNEMFMTMCLAFAGKVFWNLWRYK